LEPREERGGIAERQFKESPKAVVFFKYAISVFNSAALMAADTAVYI